MSDNFRKDLYFFFFFLSFLIFLFISFIPFLFLVVFTYEMKRSGVIHQWRWTNENCSGEGGFKDPMLRRTMTQ